MPHLFVQPREVPLSLLGFIVPNAVAYFYDAGTSTPRPTFTDATLTVAHPHPVPANNVGVLPPIYIDPAGGPYKVDIRTFVLANPLSVSLPRYPIDNLESEELPSSQALGKIFYRLIPAEEQVGLTEDSIADFLSPWFSATRYGAIADGDVSTGSGTDNSAAIQRAIDVAEAYGIASHVGGAAHIPAGTYKLVTSISIPKGVTVAGDGKWATILFCPNSFADMDGLVQFSGTGGPPAKLQALAVLGQNGGASGCGIVVTSNGTFLEDFWVGSFTGPGSAGLVLNSTDLFVSDFAIEICLYCIQVLEAGTSINIQHGTLYQASAAGALVVNGASIENGRVVFTAVRATDCVQDGFVVSAGKATSFVNCHTIATSNAQNTVSGFNIGSSSDVSISSCTTRVTGAVSAAGVGILVTSSTSISISSGAHRGFQDGLRITSCNNVNVTGGLYGQNGRDGIRVAAGDKININAVNANDNVAIGINDANSDADCNHSITGCLTQNNAYGIYSNLTGSGYSNVIGNTARLNATKNISLNGAVARTGFSGNLPDYFDGSIPSVASAAALTLPAIPYGTLVDVVSVTGTTGVNSIVAADNFRRLVTLNFIGVVTVTDGSNLKLTANFTSTAGSCLTLFCNGTDFFEVSRAVV